MLRAVCALLLTSTLALPAARAQQAPDPFARADSLLRRGDMRRAEDIYYAAVRHQPRDPVARLALGRYLAARGALKVGAVLMEESRFFGGDARTVARDLAPVYARLGDYRALASLPGSPLTVAERVRATWLQENPERLDGPDSLTVPLLPDERGLGGVALVVGSDTLHAVIDPGATGLVLDTSWTARPGVKVFRGRTDTDRRTFAGVALGARLGALTVVNAPVRFAPMTRGDARIGLDLLGRLAPTFDPVARTLTLRRTGRLTTPAAGEAVPTVAYPGELLLVRSGDAVSLGSARGRQMLGGRWTWDARRGVLVLGG